MSRGKRNGRERITEGSYIGIVVLMILQSQKQKTHIRKSVKGKKESLILSLASFETKETWLGLSMPITKPCEDWVA